MDQIGSNNTEQVNIANPSSQGNRRKLALEDWKLKILGKFANFDQVDGFVGDFTSVDKNS